MRDPLVDFQALADEVETARPVTIARLNGPVYGGATDLALACDFRLGVDTARMFMPAAKFGLQYYPHGLRRWVTRLGLAASKSLFLTGRTIEAARDATHRLPRRNGAGRTGSTAPWRTSPASSARWRRGCSRARNACSTTWPGSSSTKPSPARCTGRASPRATCAKRWPRAPRAVRPSSPVNEMNEPVLPLTGVKVLELSQILAGPTCGQMLGDLGADVIKLEKFPAGDDARGYRRDGDSGLAPSFLMVNRGKRSLRPRHPHAARQRARSPPRARRRRGHRELPPRHRSSGSGSATSSSPPRTRALVYCSITGYGRTGPLAHQGGFDLILQAFSGLLSVTGEPGGDPSSPAIRWPTSTPACSPRSACSRATCSA